MKSQLKDMEDMEDEWLVKQMKHGVVVAFEALYYRYKRAVAKYLAKYATDQSARDDLTQEVFCRVLGGIENFKSEGPHSFFSWLYRITTNVGLDYQAAESRLEILDPKDIELFPDLSLKTPDLFEQLRGRALMRAVEHLDNKKREVVNLRTSPFYWKFHEIADILNIPAGTARRIMHDARIIIKKELGLKHGQ